jgi:hypothetical protein
MKDETSAPFDLSEILVGLARDGEARRISWTGGPPPRIDGFTVGAPLITRPAPHCGEMHPDGDELLYLISGRISVILEEQGTERVVEVEPGQALIVPRGVWHRVLPKEPSRLLHMAPGPRGEWRT